MGKIAVTGSNGMLGCHVTAMLTTEKISYVPLTRKEWDLNEWQNLEQLDVIFDGVKAIFHLGAKLPQAVNDASNSETQLLFNANVRSCLNLCEWACLRQVALVFASGSTVYENPHNQEKIREDDPKVVCGFGGFYGYSKFLAEEIIQHYVSQGLKAIILRPSSIYGYGLGSDKLIQNFLDVAESNGVIKIDQPFNRVNLIHALDVAKAAILAYEAKAWGVYNVANLVSPTIAEIADAAVRICGKGSIELGAATTNAFLRFNLDISKAVNAFSFSPSVSLEEGLILMRQQRVI